MPHEPADPQLACIYCRMSEDREGGGLGIERQRQDCERLAAQLGLTVIRTYTDNDLSAYSGRPRPGYTNMLAALRAGTYGTVLAWHTDRLHRRPTELEEYIDVCEPRRIATRTVQAGAIDLTTAAGRLMARQLGSMARYEVEHMIERQKRAREQKVQRGEYCGGPRPYGWESNGVTPVPDEIAIIRECTEAVLAGASVRSVAANLNERGLRTASGNHWDGSSLRRILRRPRNAGIIQHRNQEAGPSQWDAAVDEATWRSLCGVLDDPARIPTASNVRKYLGSGLYLCGVCGETLTSFSKGGGKPAKYKCRKNDCVLRDLVLLDRWVIGHLLARLQDKDFADVLARQEAQGVDVQAAQQALTQAREGLDELAKAFGAGEIDMQEWRIAREGAQSRKAAAEALLASAVKVNPVAELLTADDMQSAWSAWDLSRQRAAVDWMMTVCVVPAKIGRRPGGSYWDPDGVRIEWKRG
ncbi:MAG: recombinase family protein [Streptomyces sp.]|nr:recombinase family protein [Streptomyces sp.]